MDPLPKTKPLEKGVQERWPVQPRRAVLSHAEASATARTLQPRPEVEGKHGSVPGRRLPRVATYHLAGPRPHLTRWGPTRGTEEPRAQARRGQPQAIPGTPGTIGPQAARPGEPP